MKTFAWFLAGFVALVVVFAVAFTWQGRGVRVYVLAVARAAHGQGASGTVRDCAQGFGDLSAPPDVRTCQVTRLPDGRYRVVAALDSGRTFETVR